MAMTPYSGDPNVIAKLGTTPQERGLSTEQFKGKFDEGLKAFVEWFNLTHKTEFEAVQTGISEHTADNAWVAPALLNGWVNYGSGYSGVGYVKDKHGWVHIRGLIKSGTVTKGTVLFNLPTGYTPITIKAFSEISAEGATVIPCSVEITTSGQVKLGAINAGSTWLTLDGISFATY